MLAKKSPNDAVNAFKLKFINSTLGRCNDFLGKKYRPFPDFTTFGEGDLPSNSDVTFIISQYIECAEKLRSDNIVSHYSHWFWVIEGEEKDARSTRTGPPRKLTDK